MSLKIAGYLFYGPFQVEKVKVRGNQIPVIVAVVCRTGEPWNPAFRLIDMDCSGADGLVLGEHPRRGTWQCDDGGELEAYLFDAPAREGFTDASRRRLIDEISSKMVPLHGNIPLGGG